MPKLEAVLADITTLHVDAIVNAANQKLKGGGGVDGAIHRAAGRKQLLAATALFGGCATGDAVATPGFALPAKWIFHTVGPVWSVKRADAHGEGQATRARLDGLLASCYHRCLALAHEYAVRSIAFPAISTGVYRFPPERAAEVAVATVREHVIASGVDEVIFCCFNAETERIYETLIGKVPIR